jgi:hypothetical protein
VASVASTDWVYNKGCALERERNGLGVSGSGLSAVKVGPKIFFGVLDQQDCAGRVLGWKVTSKLAVAKKALQYLDVIRPWLMWVGASGGIFFSCVKRKRFCLGWSFADRRRGAVSQHACA